MKQAIAIDPGASGGFAWHDADGNPNCIPMPQTEGDVLSAIRGLASSRKEPVAYVEEVGGYVGGGGQPGSAMFTFGRGFGFILGCLMSAGFRIELVRPQKWQKSLAIGTSKDCENKAAWKRKLKAKAQQLFPTCNVTLKTCDALLILNYSTEKTHMNTPLNKVDILDECEGLV